MNILGINCGHNGSIALIQGGILKAFIQTERVHQVKNALGITRLSIEACLNKGNLTLDQIDAVGINGYLYQPKESRQQAGFMLTDLNGQEWGSTMRSFAPGQTYAECQFRIDDKIIPAYYVHHHVAHGASAFYLSNFDESAIFTVDASEADRSTGLFTQRKNRNYETCSSFAIGSGNQIKLLPCPKAMIGNLYTEVCEAIGFPPLEGAGKIMGLASYGTPLHYKGLHQAEPDSTLADFWRDCGETEGVLIDASKAMEKRSQDIAASIQKLLEESMVAHAQHLYNLTGLKNLCLAGGTALNSVANKLIMDRTPFENLFVVPAATDDGTAIGAAFYIYHQIHNFPRQHQSTNSILYGGGFYSNEDIQNAIRRHPQINYRQYNHEAELLQETAQQIANGKIIGWFQENCEIGPRALGHRSILADPRNAAMKDILNRRVKFREGFRPFAPSILLEHVQDYFDINQPSPFMLFVARCKKPDVIPSAVHVDGTGRLQTVTKEDNGIFYDLIAAFYKITGVPVILDTSFNIKGKPIVETPGDALDCFLKTNIDILVMGNYLITKNT